MFRLIIFTAFAAAGAVGAWREAPEKWQAAIAVFICGLAAGTLAFI
jgi:hypothetical protein